MRHAPVALVTCARQPQLTADDRLLAQALERRGVPSTAHAWDASVDWTGFRAVVLHSTWDDHLRHGDLAWLDGLEACRVPVRSPVALVRWNAHRALVPAEKWRRVRSRAAAPFAATRGTR